MLLAINGTQSKFKKYNLSDKFEKCKKENQDRV